MQQTETYKLNKPETTDPFTPAPLNENADKIEAELARVDASAAALAQRIETLELHRMAVGHFSKSGFVNLGFTPKAVLALKYGEYALAVTGATSMSGRNGVTLLTIVENGFTVSENLTSGRYLALI